MEVVMEHELLKEKDKQSVIGSYARNDVSIVRGEGVYCFGASGKKYIDFTSGIGVNSLGYADQEWAQAVSKQAQTLQHTSNLYYSEPNTKLAGVLTARTGLKKVFFSNSGAEANECAIKAARKYSYDRYGLGRHDIITLQNSFHGRTMATISATGQDNFHKFYYPFMEGFSYTEADSILNLRNAVTESTCAIMLEVIQGEGGVIPLSTEFIKEAQAICDEKDILLIIDEIQTGIGRTGRLFAYEHFDLKPDIVTAAKGLGGGLPIGATLFGEKCEAVFSYGDHGSTFGGNPVSCVGALVVLSRINETFLREVTENSTYLIDKLNTIPEISEVSGMGYMLGAVIPGLEAAAVVSACAENGLLLLTAKDRLRFLPPLIMTKNEIDEGIVILSKVLSGRCTQLIHHEELSRSSLRKGMV
jgi:acetylornithine/N-succinyldiaminopimelate aminotransferase